MKRTVAHFIRKSTQLRASFIQNQILSHIEYDPVVISKYESKKTDGGFARFKSSEYQMLSLWNEKDVQSKLLYDGFKLITYRDVKKIEDFISERNVDLLHFHYGTDAGVYYPFLKNTQIPSVVSFYGYDCSGFPRRFMGYGKRYLNRRVFPYVDKVLAMSPDMKKDLIAAGCPEHKIIVHYYGTDVKRFHIGQEYDHSRSPVRFLLIAGLEPQKGPMFLLEAFRQAYHLNPSIRLDIVGDGRLRKEILEFIQVNDMGGYVNYHGPTVYASQEHMDFFRNADVFIHPSVTDTNGDKEGIPGAIVEAMAAGLPVISTYHAGIPYIIDHGQTGILVDEWNYKQLQDAILLLADDGRLREEIGKAGQSHALNNLDLHKKERALEQIYYDLLLKVHK